MILPATPEVVQDIVDSADERELWIVGREFERPPYFHVGKGGDTRLTRALRLCTEDKISPNSDGSYQVQGSEGRSYRVAESCSCPNSQKASSRWCYHAVGVALYVEWQRRLRPVAPVELGTLRAGTAPMSRVPTPDDDELGNGFPVDDETLPLPLPPVTVDERLAAAAHDAQARALAHDAQPAADPGSSPGQALPLIAHREEGPVYTTSDGTRYTLPEGEIMAEDESQYIPEPNVPPVAVLDAPERKEERKESPRPLPGPVLLPSLDAQTLKRSMQEWSAQRQVIRSFLQQELKEGIDFYRLQVRGKDANPSLSKAGAEKFLGLFQLQASFAPDLLTWEMLGKPTDHVIYICTLRTRSGEIVGEGRGSRSLKKDSGDTNKAIKMSEKSALIDAVLRTGALSEVYTQDAEDMQEEPAKAAPAKPTSQEQRQRIWAMVQAQAPDMRTREQVEAWIQAETRYTLHPDNYANIIVALEARA